MAYPGMTACPTLSIVVPVLCGLLCFNIECVSCASYILHKNPESDGDLHEPISDSTPDDLYVNSSPNCCSNASCIYDMVANALQQSPEFDYISSLMLINNGGPPDFIPIEVQVSWREVTNDTTTNQSSNISYVWGVTAAKAVFGPVQDIFPTPSMYNVLLAMLSVVEEAIIPKELISPQADKINTRLQEEHESIILDLSHTCISYSRQMNAKTLNLTIQMCIEEALQLGQPLTSSGSVVSNETGHVVLKSEVNYLLATFLIVYILALPFLILVSIFVNRVIHEDDGFVCNKLDKNTRHHLFLSTATTTWILLLCNIILMIIFTFMELIKWKNSPQYFSPLFIKTKHSHMYYHNIPQFMLSIVYIHRLAIIIPTVVLFVFFFIALCIGSSVPENGHPNAQEGGENPEDGDRNPENGDRNPEDGERNPEDGDAGGSDRNGQHQPGNEPNAFKYCSLTNISTAAMIFFAFTCLWDFIPLIPHLIVYPYRTLSIIFQCICVLFLLHCFMYHLLKGCSCSEFNNDGISCCNRNFSKRIETLCKTCDCTSKTFENICCCNVTCSCTSRTVCQLFLSLFSLVFLVSIGFLYIIAVLLGVSATAVTLSALSTVSAIAIATATDAMKCIVKKILEVLKCKEKEAERPTNDPV